MANGTYVKFAEALLKGDIDFDVADIRAILVDNGQYTVNLTTHDFLDDIPVGARTAVSGTLGGITVTNGVFDANDVTFSSVSGPQSEAVVLYIHTGTEGTSRLICYFDTATGLPVLPNGGNITVTWDNGTNRILKIG
jgi:hypothetical protein